jgi:hypothetical protein
MPKMIWTAEADAQVRLSLSLGKYIMSYAYQLLLLVLDQLKTANFPLDAEQLAVGMGPRTYSTLAP